MKRTVVMLLAVGALASCAPPMIASQSAADARASERRESIERLVSTVRDDPAKKPLLARSLMSGTVFMIPDPHAPALAVLPFYQNERSFIPVFSDQATFDEEAYGTGFDRKAIAVDGARFASLLNGDEIVILNPGHHPAIEFDAAELKAAAAR